MLYGWTGKILRVDLTSGAVTTIETERYIPDFVGGVGIAARIAWEELAPGVDAFDDGNMLFLMVGPLTGTLASGAGRVEVLGIAPQQRPSIFSRSSMGGHWGAELKYAGFDGVVVQGRAGAPVYLWVHDGEAELRDAAHLWGRGTYGTTRALRMAHGPQTRVVSCGQAGEAGSRIAVVQTETGNAAGQGGFGAVMGTKLLKAIAVRGTGAVRVAQPRTLLDLCLNGSREGQSPQTFDYRRWMEQRSGGEKATFRMKKCGFCATPCQFTMTHNAELRQGPSVPSVAMQCWGYEQVPRRSDAVTRAMTSDYGLNGWEIAYGIIPWLELCKQHGLIDTLDGIDIPIPDEPILYRRDAVPWPAEAIEALIKKIAFRDGELGDALADGACYAGERLFGGAGADLLDRIYPRRAGQTTHWAGHWGTGGNIYWPHWLPPTLQWCVDTRDPASDSTHQWAEHVMRYIEGNRSPHPGPIPMERVRQVCAAVYGHPDVCDPDITYDPPEVKAIPALWHSHRAMLVNSLVLCDREHSRVFSMLTEDNVADTAMMARLFSACTGYDVTQADLDRAGERIWTLLRALDVRNFRRDRRVDLSSLNAFTLPGRDDGVTLDPVKFERLLDSYYELSGWDRSTGWPTRERLAALGMPDVADGLEDAGKLGGSDRNTRHQDEHKEPEAQTRRPVVVR